MVFRLRFRAVKKKKKVFLFFVLSLTRFTPFYMTENGARENESETNKERKRATDVEIMINPTKREREKKNK